MLAIILVLYLTILVTTGASGGKREIFLTGLILSFEYYMEPIIPKA